MNTYVALLRAVNVGGTGKLPMTDLKAMCESAGYASVRTYIASGNVVFTSSGSASKVKSTLEQLLAEYAGKPVGVLVRTADEMAQVLANNPYAEQAPNRTVAIFLDKAPPADTIAKANERKAEEIALGAREIYVFYGEGIGESKLKLAAATEGTGRNMNTIAKLVAMAAT